MSKTLWHTIKIAVPKEMVNITKNDKVVVKKSLTKNNNISKSNKEPSIKIISSDINKPKIINDGKEWNVDELKIKMKKSKDLGNKNEETKKDKAAKVITKEIIFSQLKNKSKEDLLKLYTRLVIYFNPVLNDNSNLKNSFSDFNKDELLTKMNNLKNKLTNKEAVAFFNLSNNITKDEKMAYSAKSRTEYRERMKQYRKEQQKENKLLKKKLP